MMGCDGMEWNGVGPQVTALRGEVPILAARATKSEQANEKALASAATLRRQLASLERNAPGNAPPPYPGGGRGGHGGGRGTAARRRNGGAGAMDGISVDDDRDVDGGQGDEDEEDEEEAEAEAEEAEDGELRMLRERHVAMRERRADCDARQREATARAHVASEEVGVESSVGRLNRSDRRSVGWLDGRMIGWSDRRSPPLTSLT